MVSEQLMSKLFPVKPSKFELIHVDFSNTIIINIKHPYFDLQYLSNFDHTLETNIFIYIHLTQTAYRVRVYHIKMFIMLQ